MTSTLEALLLVEKAELVQVHFTLCLRDQHSMWMQDDCKVYVHSYMALIGLCFTVAWTVFKNRLLEVGPTQNRETMTLRTLTTVVLFCIFYHVWRPAWIKIHWNSIGWGPDHICLHTTLEGPRPHYMILEMNWDGLWTLSFGLSQFHGHGSWLLCEVALSKHYDLTLYPVLVWKADRYLH